MKNNFKAVVLIAAISAAIAATPIQANAQGIPVADGQALIQHIMNVTESINQTLKQVEQYKTQLQQYENMLMNSKTPDYYQWADSVGAMDGLINNLESLDFYRNKLGSYQEYLDIFKLPDEYKMHQCFQAEGCDDATRAKLESDLELIQEANKAANNDSFRTIDTQQDNLKKEAQRLRQLQNSAQTATGQMEALQYANQFAAEQVYQIQQMRGAMLVQQQAATSQMATNQNDRAVAEANHKIATEAEIINGSSDKELSFIK